MAVKVTVGLAKKIGQPDYGSLGANCSVEFEVETALLQCDLEGFHQQVRKGFTACRQAVSDELAREQGDHAKPLAGSPASTPAHGNGHAPNGQSNGGARKPRLATQAQAKAIRAIASRQGLDLAQLLDERYGLSHLEDLSLSDASALIDELKAANGQDARR